MTQILGIRAFGSQLLCEQVVGRGLRRMDYPPDPATGRLPPEHVDVYGIPFSVIPFKGRAVNRPQPEDRPKTHVHALPERARLKPGGDGPAISQWTEPADPARLRPGPA